MIDPKTLHYIERLAAKAATWRNACLMALLYAVLMTALAVYLAWGGRL